MCGDTVHSICYLYLATLRAVRIWESLSLSFIATLFEDQSIACIAEPRPSSKRRRCACLAHVSPCCHEAAPSLLTAVRTCMDAWMQLQPLNTLYRRCAFNMCKKNSLCMNIKHLLFFCLFVWFRRDSLGGKNESCSSGRVSVTHCCHNIHYSDGPKWGCVIQSSSHMHSPSVMGDCWLLINYFHPGQEKVWWLKQPLRRVIQ